MRVSKFRLSILMLVVLALTTPYKVLAQQEEESTSTPNKQEETTTDSTPPKEDTFDAQGHTEWGNYYDPQNVFCGNYDCYKILGFDYEEFSKEIPSRTDITKRYRSLSRLWHPDKNKRRDAKDRFVKIARAYEVLTDNDTRKEYDAMRYDQNLYFDKYGSSVLWQYAPQSDAYAIVFVLICVGSAFTWFVQKNKWQTVANRLTQAAVEDWGPRDGGTTESKQLRQRAMDILQEREGNATSLSNNNGNGSSSPSKNNSTPTKVSPSKSKKNRGMTGKEKKKQLEESIRPVVVELVNEIDDFGGGFHKPTWRDLLIVSLVKLPVTLSTGILWNAKYFCRRLLKKQLNDEEREVLTRRAVGEVTWAAVSDEDRKEMVTLDLWVSDNLQEWREQQEVKTWSAGDQKKYARMKKKGFKMHDE